MNGTVFAVHSSPSHTLAKASQGDIYLIPGIGVRGDAHAGSTVQHRSRVAKNPDAPNYRQVHLIGMELFCELTAAGFTVTPGTMGENVTTHGIDLAALPNGTRLHLGNEAVIQVTGLRNPCVQLEGIAPGLMKAVLGRRADGGLIRKAGIMAVVLVGGTVRVDDPIVVRVPSPPHQPLAPV